MKAQTERNQAIIDELNSGISAVELSKKYNISIPRISAIKKNSQSNQQCNNGEQDVITKNYANITPEEKKQQLEGEISFTDPWRLFPVSERILPYNPSALVTTKGLEIFDRMKKDEQIKSALEFKKDTVLSAGWEIGGCGDEEIDDFVGEQLEGIPGAFDNTIKEFLTGMDYGYSISEIVWQKTKKGKLGIKDIKTRSPYTFDFIVNEFGDLVSIQQQVFDKIEYFNPINKFIVFSYQKEFGNFYGKSDLESAYRAWWHKDNALKWLAMLLEKYGIPPVFFFFDPTKYSPQQILDLKSVVSNMQANTNGVIPRTLKEALEPWSPQLADNTKEAFMPAITMYDLMIAKALLMPSLLGFTPDSSAGSNARSRVHFGTYLLVIDRIQRVVAQNVIEDQIIKPLIDLNFNNIKEYPRFKFLDIDSGKKEELFKSWGELLKVGAVKSQESDERHIRKSLRFPEIEERPKMPEVQLSPQSDGQEYHDHSHEIRTYATKYEKRSNIKEIDKNLTNREAQTIDKIVKVLTDAKKQIFDKINNFKDPLSLTPKKIKNDPEIDIKIKKIFESEFVGVFKYGRSTLKDEIKEIKQRNLSDVNFVPEDAIAYILERENLISAVLTQDFFNDIRVSLIQSIEKGESRLAMQDRLDVVLSKYIGDPTKLKDGKPLPPYRIENIVRTELSSCFNQGRLTEGRQSGVLQGFQYSAILDKRTTQVCQLLDGKIFKINDPALDSLRPPNHFQCRSMLVPVTIYDVVDQKDFVTQEQVGAAKGEAIESFV